MVRIVNIQLEDELRESDAEVALTLPLIPGDQESEHTKISISYFLADLVVDAFFRQLRSAVFRFITYKWRINYQNERNDFICPFRSKVSGLKAMEVQKLQFHQKETLNTNSLGDAMIKSRKWFSAKEFEDMGGDDFVPRTPFDGCFKLEKLRPSARSYKASKVLLPFEYNPKIHNLVCVDVMKCGSFTTPDIQHVPANGGDIDTEIEKMLREAGALRARDLDNHENDHDAANDCKGGRHNPSHNAINAIIKLKRVHLYSVLLLMASLVAKITYQAAFSLLGGILRERAYGYAENGTLQVKKHDSIVTGSFILFNSTGFVASVAVIIFLLHDFPLKPWPQITVSTLFGSYMCLIMATSPHEAWAILFLATPFLLLAAAGKFL